MAAPYTSTSVSGYNSNPPADDGSQVASNGIFWATIKTKLSDPLNTFASSVNSNISTAFGKVLGGGGVTTTAISYQVVSGDQGKLVKTTGAGGITLTTPDATVVTSPFVFAVSNNSSSAITIDGSGSQTVDGNLTITIAAGAGCILFTDGSNWFTTGNVGALVGKQLGYSDIINGTLVESNATNAVTFALKTLAGSDPSSADPVLLCFRNATAGTGNYVFRTVTAALSLTISSGSTLGATSGVAFKVWLVIFDDGGTIRLGAINCVNGTNIFALGRTPIASSTQDTGAGAADSAHTFYTNGAGVTSKPYLVFGVAYYESGLASAGAWNVSPSPLQLFGLGIPLPGTVLQVFRSITGAVATGTTLIPYDDTIPQSSEGDQYMTLAITPQSKGNVLEIEAQGNFSTSAGANNMAMALFQSAVANALAVVDMTLPTAADGILRILHAMLAPATSSTTFNIRAGANNAATTTFNGSGSARKYGGVYNSFIKISEIVG